MITAQLAAEAYEGQPCALIHVRDNGRGIAPEHLPNLFRPFYRGAANGQHSGAGLGLTITKEIVEMHGGAISAESEVGKGSVFTIRLPLVVLQNEQTLGQKAQ